jgi:hypothetical protein
MPLAILDVGVFLLAGLAVVRCRGVYLYRLGNSGGIRGVVWSSSMEQLYGKVARIGKGGGRIMPANNFPWLISARYTKYIVANIKAIVHIR